MDRGVLFGCRRMVSMTNITVRRRVIHQPHQSGCFISPNPWDAGSARLLAQLGFSALATTSSGAAWSVGRRDNQMPLPDVRERVRSIVDAVDVPVSADFEGGFAVDPEGVAANFAA